MPEKENEFENLKSSLHKILSPNPEDEPAEGFKYFYICSAETNSSGGVQWHDGVIQADSKATVIIAESLLQKRKILNLLELTEEEFHKIQLTFEKIMDFQNKKDGEEEEETLPLSELKDFIGYS